MRRICYVTTCAFASVSQDFIITICDCREVEFQCVFHKETVHIILQCLVENESFGLLGRKHFQAQFVDVSQADYDFPVFYIQTYVFICQTINNVSHITYFSGNLSFCSTERLP